MFIVACLATHDGQTYAKSDCSVWAQTAYNPIVGQSSCLNNRIRLQDVFAEELCRTDISS